jgi:electron transfer flavoprotein alpha subunit
MTSLVVAEHDNAVLKPATLNVVAVARQIGGDVAVLVVGAGCRSVAEAAAAVEGVAKVLLADDPAYEHRLAENVTPLIVELAKGYSHILAAATSAGKSIMPRVAALLDVAQISEISVVESPDTFVRPI